MPDKPSTEPVNVTPFPNGEVGVVWSDGHESYFNGQALRCACGCAKCVDEVTGRKMLIDSNVPEDVQALAIHPVGRYGLSVEWSDGHDTGIYAFKTLRKMCPCDDCR